MATSATTDIANNSFHLMQIRHLRFVVERSSNTVPQNRTSSQSEIISQSERAIYARLRRRNITNFATAHKFILGDAINLIHTNFQHLSASVSVMRNSSASPMKLIEQLKSTKSRQNNDSQQRQPRQLTFKRYMR
uniref:Uncharacterized protein n=1 Tax=Parascaris univalens TaxID=6257 RepID=A0A915AWX0_PARUN